ncbi:hypothetical protein SAMN05880501_10837 [Ureibacillus xyleni]|uniref:Uncharacterized protein n=1 Tax=Ureibacillus xyleni TaxID=614648 RepID=A0A285T1I5_9BACL|nr:hypothetical protein SAMN05880501_10837 [Ureibacillus xyleni]
MVRTGKSIIVLELNELKECGYIKRFLVYEAPPKLLSENVNVSNQNPASLHQQNEGLLNTDLY